MMVEGVRFLRLWVVGYRLRVLFCENIANSVGTYRGASSDGVKRRVRFMSAFPMLLSTNSTKLPLGVSRRFRTHHGTSLHLW